MPLRNLIANAGMFHIDGPGLLALARNLEYVLIAALGVPLLMLALAAIAGNMVQHRLVWSGESAQAETSARFRRLPAPSGYSASRRRRISPRAFSSWLRSARS